MSNERDVSVETLVTMCERLAYKFNQPQHYDDLVSEGTLKVYEMLGNNPEEHPANLYREAKRRMHDYINFDCHGLSVPASDAARAIVRGNDTKDRDDYSERGLEALRATLESEWGGYDEDFAESSLPTAEQSLINKTTGELLTQVIFEGLDEEEAQVIILRYFEDATQEEVADLYDVSHQAISLKEKKALRKMRLRLCNIL